MPATEVDSPALRERAARFLAGMRGRGRRQPNPPQPALEPPAQAQAGVAHVWELGHFYSPVPDTRELAREPGRSRVWPEHPRETPGLDWRGEEQLRLLHALAEQPPLAGHHRPNPNFSALDAWVLQGMLRHLGPRRVVEVGCGFSSLVTAHVNRECFGGAVDVTCIEPYPPDFLTGGVDGIGRLIPSPVQDVPLETFAALEARDVLFIDTSHVIKTGNDVQFLYQEVVPRLRAGVLVHIHDIFLPREYPPDWVLGGRAWNEQYLVESFLAFNGAFEVMLGVGWLCTFHRDAVADAAGDAEPGGGGSLWIRRRDAG
ncbi:MAG: class I SAM-dependent methyltransferase [Solirubrobacteraceae bacterium]